MYQYTDWVTADFADRKKELSEFQRQAEQSDLSGQERARRLDTVWDRIQELPSVADMRRSVLLEEQESISKERESYRVSIKQELEALADRPRGATPLTIKAESWVAYEAAESLALEWITQATLTMRTDRDELNPIT
jgi:hypothetical protein